jgi:GNAT superfamily N-acetyltransferase
MSSDLTAPVQLDATYIPRAMLLSNEAGWNQTEADWAIFFTHGTVLGLLDGDRLVATAAALPYGGSFGWISMVLVTGDYRRRGLATRITAACTSVLRDGGKAALLDAAENAAAIYARLGYSPLCEMERWEGEGGGEPRCNSGSRMTRELLLRSSLDRTAFGADRNFLFKDFLARPESDCFLGANGFTISRPGRRSTQIGPVVADAKNAPAVLEEAIRATSGRVIVDVLDAGSVLHSLLERHGFRPQRHFTRMALGLPTLPGDPSRLLAAAGPEFG